MARNELEPGAGGPNHGLPQAVQTGIPAATRQNLPPWSARR
ncbi:hypothetical protein [Methylobacterium pseudosasicola]|nr:hypothetical protein [Methylobacterium pseudosasicola]